MTNKLTIRVSGFELEISAPYSEGMRMTEAEAKNLNSLRADRIRNILYKKISETSSLEELQGKAQDLDRQFELRYSGPREPTAWTFEDELEATALERAMDFFHSLGVASPEPSALGMQISGNKILDEVKELAKQRFAARQAVINEALSELL